MLKFLHHCIVVYSPCTCRAGTLWHGAVEHDIEGPTPGHSCCVLNRMCNHLCAMLWMHIEECQVVKISHKPMCCFASFSLAKFSRPPLDAAVPVGFHKGSHPTGIANWQALSSTSSDPDIFKCTAGQSWHGKGKATTSHSYALQQRMPTLRLAFVPPQCRKADFKVLQRVTCRWSCVFGY